MWRQVRLRLRPPPFSFRSLDDRLINQRAHEIAIAQPLDRRLHHQHSDQLLFRINPEVCAAHAVPGIIANRARQRVAAGRALRSRRLFRAGQPAPLRRARYPCLCPPGTHRAYAAGVGMKADIFGFTHPRHFECHRVSYFQNCREASAAPSAMALSLANTTSGSTAA